MKNTLILCILILLYSCQKDSNIEYPSISSIRGKIENWNLGSNKIIIFGLDDKNKYGKSSIDVNGNFNISSLSIPTELMPIDSSFFGYLFKVSNHNAKIKEALLRVFSANDLNNQIYSVYASNRIFSPNYYIDGDFEIFYVYVDEDVSLTGSKILSIMGTSITYIASLNLKKGWNKYVLEFVSSDPKSQQISYITETDPLNLKWFYDLY